MSDSLRGENGISRLPVILGKPSATELYKIEGQGKGQQYAMGRRGMRELMQHNFNCIIN